MRGNVLHASLSKNWYEACNAECCMPDDVGLRETLLVLKALAVKYTAYGCVHGRPCGMRWYHPHEWRAPVDSVGMKHGLQRCPRTKESSQRPESRAQSMVLRTYQSGGRTGDSRPCTVPRASYLVDALPLLPSKGDPNPVDEGVDGKLCSCTPWRDT